MQRPIHTLLTELCGPALVCFASVAASAGPVPTGVLECTVAPGPGFILGSAKDVSCIFRPVRGRPEYYAGRLSRFGVDVGVTGRSLLSWAVYIATPAGRYPLSGYFAGTGAGIAFLAGAAADALIGGERNAVTLTPLSSASPGLNLSAGTSSLMLQPSPIPPRF